MEHLVEVKPQVGHYACIQLAPHVTAQGKVSYIGHNGQVTIMAGDRIITGHPIPSLRRPN